MTPFEIGIASVIFIVVMIYAGLYIPVALGLVSFLGVWIIRDDIDIAINMLALAAADTVSHQVFATVPLFAMMGLIVSQGRPGQRCLQSRELYLLQGQGRPRDRNRRRQCGLRRHYRVFDRIRFGVRPGVRAGDAQIRLYDAFFCRRRCRLFGARHDHPAKRHADHLCDHGRSVGGSALPCRHYSRCPAGGRFRPRDYGYGALLAQFRRRSRHRRDQGWHRGVAEPDLG